MKQRITQQRRQQRSNASMLKKTNCPHGFDIACLICGFGEEDGKRVWHDWTNKEKDVA
jgi:hypothetical protein